MYFLVQQVKSDSFGKMDPNDLRRAIKESRSKGFVPFFVNATSGTTVLGSFDPIGEIAAVCLEENLWLHIDVSMEQIKLSKFHQEFMDTWRECKSNSYVRKWNKRIP